jgi:hypothetical protein
MAKKKNRNDYFLKNIIDLDEEVLYQDFEYKEHFIHLCNLVPNQELEKLEIEAIDKDKIEIAGTNSTTNYFVLQSFLKINQIVNVYAFFPVQPRYSLFGKEYQDSFPTSKRAENEILKDFVKKHTARNPLVAHKLRSRLYIVTFSCK